MKRWNMVIESPNFFAIWNLETMILNIDKPVGWTSFDVVKKVRGITKEKKVGHAGTLDPFASGVLIIGTGKDTKILTSISNKDKKYIAELTLGKTTDTLDTEGTIIHSQSVPALNLDSIKGKLISFLGKQEQVPPMFSAKKKNGTRLYKLARKKIVVDREPIIIDIKEIKLVQLKNNCILFSVCCSKGTYIRVLGKDIAEKLGTVGYLTLLKRIKIGHYDIKYSQTISEFESAWRSTAH
tara:strand:+ start:1443 stop:2159 length:717 start_codon:yes stop_codon:yes gene_type:complete